MMNCQTLIDEADSTKGTPVSTKPVDAAVALYQAHPQQSSHPRRERAADETSAFGARVVAAFREADRYIAPA
jgi:hypothetical protein